MYAGISFVYSQTSFNLELFLSTLLRQLSFFVYCFNLFIRFVQLKKIGDNHRQLSRRRVDWKFTLENIWKLLRFSDNNVVNKIYFLILPSALLFVMSTCSNYLWQKQSHLRWWKMLFEYIFKSLLAFAWIEAEKGQRRELFTSVFETVKLWRVLQLIILHNYAKTSISV